MSTSEPQLWQYGMPDLDETDGLMTFDGTPRIITPRMIRRPLVPAGPWEPALRIAPECSTSQPKVHADCDGCDCRCHPADLEQIKARFLAAQRDQPVLLHFGPAYGDKAGPGTSVEIVHPPRRRWWHRYTRRTQ